MEAKHAVEGERLNSGLLEVARYAGQTVGLYFGYTGGESTNAVATPEGIFFYRAAARELHARRQGQSVVVTWTVPAASTACGAIEIGPLGLGNSPLPSIVNGRVLMTHDVATITKHA